MKKKGFTLVELLAVIVVLAIILVIAVPRILEIIDESKIGSMTSSVKIIAEDAEKKKLELEALEIGGVLTCANVAGYNSDDYDSCTISFNNNTPTVTLNGKDGGKFDGMTCTGTKESVTCEPINDSNDTENNEDQMVTITVNGALSDKVSYSGTAEGSFNLNEKGAGTVTLKVGAYTFVSQRSFTTDFTTRYSRNYTITTSTTTINFYPAGAIYWFGNGAVTGSSLYSKCGGAQWSYQDVEGINSGKFTSCAKNQVKPGDYPLCHNDYAKSNLNDMRVRMTSNGGNYYAKIGCTNTISKGSYTKMRALAQAEYDATNFDNSTYFLHGGYQYNNAYTDFTGKKYVNISAVSSSKFVASVRTKNGGTQGIIIYAIWLA